MFKKSVKLATNVALLRALALWFWRPERYERELMSR